jgi:phosphoglycerate dehydrogenase-like enzyme
VVAVLLGSEWRDEIIGPESEAALRAFADVRTASSDRLTGAELPALLDGAVAAISGWGTPPLSMALLGALPSLRMIAHSAGTIRSIVPAEAVRDGLVVSQSTANLAIALAEHVVALALLCLQRQHEDDRLMRAGGFADAARRQRRLLLGARTVGIWGLGRAGQAAAALFTSFGCRLLGHDPVAATFPAGVERVETLAELFEQSEIVVILAPSLPSTRGAVDATMLARLKDGGVVINAGRAPLLDHEALARELRTGRIHAALDVYPVEPPPADDPLRQLPNTLLTPHVGGHTRDTHRRQGRDSVEEVRRFLAGEPLRYQVLPELMDTLA